MRPRGSTSRFSVASPGWYGGRTSASGWSTPGPQMSSIASSSTPKRAKPAATAHRTHLAGALTRADVGREVRLAGWVHRRRDLGGLVLFDLRVRSVLG